MDYVVTSDFPRGPNESLIVAELEILGGLVLGGEHRAARTDSGKDREVWLWYDPSLGRLRLQIYSVAAGAWTEFGLSDFFLEVAAGNVPGHSAVIKFGRNPDIDQIASATAVLIGRDLWDLGIAGATKWVSPTTARTHQIASSNDEDGGAGTDTGALTMEIYGLDAAYALQNETITLNGTTNVPTANTYTNIHRGECLTFGSAERNLGDITMTADTDATVTAQVTADNNQTLMAIYQIPAGKTGYITSWKSELHKTGGAGTFADITLMSMKFGGGWRVRDTMALATDGTGSDQQEFRPYKKLEAKEYVKVVGAPSKDAQDIGGGFDLILKDDSA